MSSPRRSLVILKPQYLGDAVMALPLIDSLTKSGREVFVRAMPHIIDMLQDRAGAVEFIPGSKFSGLRSLLAESAKLKSAHFDEVFVVDRSFRSALVAWKSGIRRRLGHPTEGRGFLLTESLRYDLTKSEVECYLDLARLVEIETSSAIPKLSVTDAELREGARLTNGLHIGVQPGARYVEKQYPLSKMAEALNPVLAKYGPCVLFGGKEESESAREFAELIGNQCVSLVGSTSLRESMAAMANLKVMVGSDTGLMHVAAALGTPTVTVFGPNPASKWGHFDAPHQVLASPDGIMASVAVEDVTAATFKALSGG